MHAGKTLEVKAVSLEIIVSVRKERTKGQSRNVTPLPTKHSI